MCRHYARNHLLGSRIVKKNKKISAFRKFQKYKKIW